MTGGSDAWQDARLPARRFGLGDYGRILRRGLPIALLTYGGLLLLLALRLIEAPIFGRNRPWTPHITQFVCRGAVWLMGIPMAVRGTPMRQRGAVVSNHVAWLDIFALNAVMRIYFVAKAEVAAWPGIGWLARATGTLFINRKGAEAKFQQRSFEDRIRAGHKLLFFPEGTSTDALRVLPFKSTLFAAFWTHGLEHVMHIQPVSLVYHAPPGQDARFYGWWGDMAFAPHLIAVLAAPRQGRIEVILHPPVAVDEFADRKALAAHCESTIRAGLTTARAE